MKALKLFLTMAALALVIPAQAQTVDEILENYFENTGGVDAWKALEGIKISAKANQQGMEFPLEIYQLKDKIELLYGVVREPGKKEAKRAAIERIKLQILSGGKPS